MKIEIGESLLLSWLKHIKECQLVQTNWKASYKWELKNKETLEQLMRTSTQLFSQKYGYDIYKGNKSLDQLLGQAEIDVIGINYEENQSYIYAIDVAFHEAGLNYGSKDETVTRVIKKCLRTAMCIYGYFSFSTGTIIFTSPKIKFNEMAGIAHMKVFSGLPPSYYNVLSLSDPGSINRANSKIAIIWRTLRVGFSCLRAIALSSTSGRICLHWSLSARSEGRSASHPDF